MLGERLAATCFAKVFFFGGVDFLTPKKLRVQEVEIHSFAAKRLKFFVQHGKYNNFLAENSGDITCQLDEMLWMILSKVASCLFFEKNIHLNSRSPVFIYHVVLNGDSLQQIPDTG